MPNSDHVRAHGMKWDVDFAIFIFFFPSRGNFFTTSTAPHFASLSMEEVTGWACFFCALQDMPSWKAAYYHMRRHHAREHAILRGSYVGNDLSNLEYCHECSVWFESDGSHRSSAPHAAAIARGHGGVPAAEERSGVGGIMIDSSAGGDASSSSSSTSTSNTSPSTSTSTSTSKSTDVTEAAASALTSAASSGRSESTSVAVGGGGGGGDTGLDYDSDNATVGTLAPMGSGASPPPEHLLARGVSYGATTSFGSSGDAAVRSADWLLGRDDTGAMGPSQPSALLGEVLLAAFPTTNRGRPRGALGSRVSDAEWLPALSRDHRKFGRWRVVSAAGAEGDELLTVYDIDRHDSFEDARQGAPSCKPVQEWRWRDIDRFVVCLGRGDVTTNPPLSLDDSSLRCDSCQASAADLGGRQMLRVCDGNYPSLNVTGTVADSAGAHFRCYRGVVCFACLPSEGAPGKWFCAACRDTPPPSTS